MTLIICGLAEAPGLIATRAPSHMITLLDGASLGEALSPLPPERHLKLAVNDIAEPAEGLVLPDEALVLRLLEFSRGWDASAPMLVHCWAGISRSTAGAFAIACDRNPHADEREIALHMRASAVHASPNRRIVALADTLLGRRGRMVQAVEAMGDYDYTRARPFDLPAAF
ncbi:tyrosine phosphatase family protein [Phenylobacterium sp.]|uniref:tyrosine phosphatase family protein n=1 Tax=Phenylobacterium sp. TaxID=1871053 RepID=UPI0035B0B79A